MNGKGWGLVYIAHELTWHIVNTWHRSYNYGKAKPWILGNLEHELRLLGDPVWMGIANGEHEPHLRILGGQAGGNPHALAGSAIDWLGGSTDHRGLE